MKNSPWIIIVVLAIIIFFMMQNKPEAVQLPPEIVIQYDTIHDSIPYPVKEYVPEISYRDTGSTKWLTDTVFVYKDYHSTNFYADTLVDDSLLFVCILDSVSRNRIKFRKPIIKYYQTTIKESTSITKYPKAKNKYFIGLGVGRSPTEFGLSPSVLMVTKKESAFSLSYDVMNKDVYFSYYWKITFF